MVTLQPMHDGGDLYHEQQNKWALLSNKGFLENLLSIFVRHVERGTGALVVSALLDLLTFAMCPPYSETTDGAQFDALLELVASHGRVVFQLFQHPSVAIVKGAGLVMRAIIEVRMPRRPWFLHLRWAMAGRFTGRVARSYCVLIQTGPLSSRRVHVAEGIPSVLPLGKCSCCMNLFPHS